MEFGNSWMPDLNKPGMRAEDKLRAINEYLIDFEKKVRHALSNIDEDNLSEAFISTLNGTAAKVQKLEENKGGGDTCDVASVDGIKPDADGNVALGAVRTVNGEAPDAAGNVEVDGGQQGPPGERGEPGADGATFIPSVSEDGVISWSNGAGLANPDPVNVMGPKGETGPAGADGVGVPAGGTDGQILTKLTGTDFETGWADPPEGGGGHSWMDVVLTAAGWAGLTQTVTVDGVTADRMGCAVVVTPAPESIEEYTGCGVKCTAQGEGTLTFTAEDAPGENVTVSVLIAK